MDRYLGRLEKNIGNTKAGKILFNKYYNLKDFYWTLIYAVGISILAGIGNVFPEIQSGKVLFTFWQGFLNNLYFSIFINLFYARMINFLGNKKHLRFNGNLLWIVLTIMFLIWHYLIGTENPIETNILPAIAAFILTNYHITTLKKSIKTLKKR